MTERVQMIERVQIAGPRGQLEGALSGPPRGQPLVFHTGTPSGGSMFPPLVDIGAERVIAAATIASVAPRSAEGLDWLDGMGEENPEELAAEAGEGQLLAFLEPFREKTRAFRRVARRSRARSAGETASRSRPSFALARALRRDPRPPDRQRRLRTAESWISSVRSARCGSVPARSRTPSVIGWPSRRSHSGRRRRPCHPARRVG